MKRQMFGAALAVSAVCTGYAHEWTGDGPDFSFGTAEAPLATGELQAPPNVQVRSLSIAPASGATVALTGGPLAFVSGGVASNRSDGVVSVEATATGTDGLVLAGTGEKILPVYPVKNVAKVLLEGARLDDWEVVSAVSCGTDIGQVRFLPYRVVQSEGQREMQMKTVNGGWVKGVKIRLSEQGGNLMVEALYARYIESSYGIGVDLDANYRGDLSVPGSDDGNGYGIRELVLRRRDAGLVPVDFRLNAPMTPNGALNVARGAVAAIGAGADFGSGAAFPETATVDGTLVVEGRETAVDVVGTVTGSGGTLGFESESPWMRNSSVGKIASWQTGVVLVENASLEDVVGFDGISMHNGKSGTAYHLKKYSGYWTVQFQALNASEGYLLSNTLKLYQSGKDVKADSVNLYFKWGGTPGEELSADNSSGQGDYPIDSMTIRTVGHHRMTVGLDNQGVDSQFVVGTNTHVLVAEARTFPKGKVQVRDNGLLELAGNDFGVSMPIDVVRGGVLRVNAGAALDASTMLFLDGGVLDYAKLVTSSYIDGDGGNYLCKATIRNGSRLAGYMPRTAQPSCTWSFGGTSPSYWESGALLVGLGQTTLTIDVADVTGNAGVDMYQTGELRDFVQSTATKSGQAGHVRKAGAGCWRMGARCPRLFGDFFLDAGSLQLGQSDTFEYLGTNIQPAMTFNGGSLVCEPDTSNGIRHIGLTADSTIVLGAGASLAFGDCSSFAWTAGKRLTIENYRPKAIRFGTDANGLTAAQLRQVRINGHRGVLDDEGYLAPYDGGLTVILK